MLCRSARRSVLVAVVAALIVALTTAFATPPAPQALATLTPSAYLPYVNTYWPRGWSQGVPMNLGRFYHTATLLPSGKILVTGGYVCSGGGCGAYPSAELCDPLWGRWWMAATPSKARTGHTATLLPSGKVLVAGGQTGGTILAGAELYDPVSNSWSPAASMAVGRMFATATLLPSGKVLVAGGGIWGFMVGVLQPLASAELYDPASDTWSPAANMSTGRLGHSATLLPSGKILVFGGAGLDPSAELYDPASNSWSPAASMTTGRVGATAILLPSGKVLVVGGQTFSTELYDPATDSWSSAGSVSESRMEPTVTLLPSGKVLVAGGVDGGNGWGSLASAELYDPASSSWSSGGTMSVPREGHTATLLPGGRVLVNGGRPDGTSGLASTEWYSP